MVTQAGSFVKKRTVARADVVRGSFSLLQEYSGHR